MAPVALALGRGSSRPQLVTHHPAKCTPPACCQPQWKRPCWPRPSIQRLPGSKLLTCAAPGSSVFPASAPSPSQTHPPAGVFEKPFLFDSDASTDLSDDSDGSSCDVFVDRDGDFLEVMCCDYGFRAGAGRLYQDSDGRIPASAFELATTSFKMEFEALRQSLRYDDYQSIAQLNPATRPLGKLGYAVGKVVVEAFSALDRFLENSHVLRKIKPRIQPEDLVSINSASVSPECSEIRTKLQALKLSNQAVWDREHKREREGGQVATPWFVRGVYLALCLFLDQMYENRPIQRFWFLETVARMPYFSYITMLHLYESLGWWRAGAELRKVHFAEEWNEMHHLQIMESLGGDQLWVDRFLGQHAAIFYYWVLLGLFFFSPALAYNFSELIEAHAVDTYGEFADANAELLKTMPPPLVAASYYRSGDLYMFDEFQTSDKRVPRRPVCNNLYDVFCNIRDDEGEHVNTMKACQNFTVADEIAARKMKTREV